MLGFKRKRTRNIPSETTNNNNSINTGTTTMNANNFINFYTSDMMDDLILDDQGRLNINNNENAILDAGDEEEDEEEDDDLMIFQQHPQLLSQDSSRYKKQRTVSLPQLPHSRLSYTYYLNSNNSNIANSTANINDSSYTHHNSVLGDISSHLHFSNNGSISGSSHRNNNSISSAGSMLITPPIRVQNDDELLHLTGSSSKTLEGNRGVQLKVAHSVSPMTVPSNGMNSNYSGFKQNFKRLLPNSNSHDNDLSQNGMARRGSGGSTNGNYLDRGRGSVKHVLDNVPNDYFKTDKDGHYIYQENDVFGSNGQFIVRELLGQGTFGKVLKCIDTCSPNNKYVAVKVIRAVDRYREAAKTELRVLSTILENDPSGQFQCLLLRDCFDYKNHICLVTDLYGRSVYDFMCSNGIARFPGSHLQAIARQLIRSVCFLHDMGIIHTDLKPENILLVDESYVEYDLPQHVIDSMSNRRRLASKGKRKILTNPEIKIIDFGSAVFHKEYHPPVISTRHYRAPEIVLGLGWSFPCDIWSIACVLIELVIGESLYPIHENLEHMAMMQRINGTPFPTKLIDKMFYKVRHKLGNLPSDLNTTVVRHFNRQSLTLQWPEKNKRGEIVTTEKSMKRVMESCDRLDIYVSRVLKQDFGERLSINWNLFPEKNWSLISSKILWRDDDDISSFDNSRLFPPPYKLDKESFLFWYWFVDLCRKMFEFDPTKRITARNAMDHEWFNLGIFDEGIANFVNSRTAYRNSI